MKANPNIDELLCSFLDGELPVRQRTEVQRLAARDPEVGRRLRQLQSCKMLVGGLPRAEAPAEMPERIRLSLERKMLLTDQVVTGRSRAGAVRLMARKLVAVAAMIALLGVLGVVVYQVVAPVPGGTATGPVAGTGDLAPIETVPPVAAPLVVADAGFSGRLEIRTAMLAQTDIVLQRAIRESGLSGLVETEGTPEARTYRVVTSRQGAGRLISGLQDVWQSSDAVTLRVEEPGEHAAHVTVEAVTPEQVSGIIASENTEATVDMAQEYALANSMSLGMPGEEVLEIVRDDVAGVQELLTFDGEVRLAGDRDRKDTTVTPPQGEANVTLTIVLLHTR